MLAAHYEDCLNFTERAVEAAVDSLSTDTIVCPICLKLVLEVY